MEFNYIADGIDAVVIDNFYTEEQLKEIMIELKWLTKPSVMLKEDKLSSAIDEDTGAIITSKHGVFLENVFKKYQHSSIITHGITQMELESFKSNLITCNSLFKSLLNCKSRCHLVSYYENSNYYKSHTDTFFFTMLSYFYTEPKQFEGGELVLSSCNSNKKATIEVKNNRVIIIASSTPHEVLEIKSKLNNTLSGDGRYCVATFLTIIPKTEEV
jgi:hypothetical protein